MEILSLIVMAYLYLAHQIEKAYVLPYVSRVGVIKIVIVITCNCNLITFFKIIENNSNSVSTLITIIEM